MSSSFALGLVNMHAYAEIDLWCRLIILIFIIIANVVIFACMNFREFEKIGKFAEIYTRVSMMIMLFAGHLK